MPDVTREDFPEATPAEKRRADIGDRIEGEVDPSERGQNLPPRTGRDIRENVEPGPPRTAGQGPEGPVPYEDSEFEARARRGEETVREGPEAERAYHAIEQHLEQAHPPPGGPAPTRRRTCPPRK